LGQRGCPSRVNTLRERPPTGEEVEADVRRTPLRRIATPGEIAGGCSFLDSDAASYITGRSIYVIGGVFLR
jgi:NAD(P)-dependent dehydrogenase (short-subunit alcohol dehydrogenase family)